MLLCYPMGINENFSALDVFNSLDVAGHAAAHPDLFAYVKEAMAQPDKQYLLIGDTSHSNETLHAFLHSPALAALFNYAAVPHVAWEEKRERIPQERLDAFREKCNQYRQGLLSPAQLNDARISFFAGGLETGRYFWDKNMLGFTQAGLRMTPADSSQWHDEGSPGVAERLFLGDREVAHYIADHAHGEKTGIVYGATHFAYVDTLGSRLGRDKCVHVDIYADRASYEKFSAKYDTHADFIPHKVYILDERRLEDADIALYRSTDKDDDPMQQARDEVAYLYGSTPQTLTQMMAVHDNLVPQPGFDPQWFTYVPG